MTLLKLGALDEDDLQVMSSHMQDAVLRVGDIRYLAATKQLVIIANRFNWETADKPATGYQRRRTGIHFNTVTAVRSSRIKHTAGDAILELLAIAFTHGEAPSGTIRLEFAGGGIVEIEVECIDAWLSDLGEEWGTAHKPQHDLDAESE